MWLDHILFTCLSVYGHLGCFLLLAVANSAALSMSKYMHESLLSFLLDIYPEVALLDL